MKKGFFSTLHVVKRENVSRKTAWLIRIAAILLALVLCGALTYGVAHINPLDFYKTLFDGSFGTKRRMWTLGQDMAILLCIALALTPAFIMHFWNNGGEGQVLIGGMASAAVMLKLGDRLPQLLLLLLMLLAALAAGALWALIPTFFKVKYNTNETLFTLMMNYIAVQIIAYFSLEWCVPKGSGWIGIINQDSQKGWLPSLAGSRYLLPILIVVILTVLMYFYLKETKHGYEIAIVGDSLNTAKYIGLNVPHVVRRTMALSGALCGLAGFLLVSGIDHTIAVGSAGGRGFTAIMVAYMAHFNVFSMILVSLLLAFMDKGAMEISTVYTMNESYSAMITGIIIFFLLGSEFFINYQIKRQGEGRTQPKEEKKGDAA